MKTKIVFLLFIALLGVALSISIAQQNQNVPITDKDFEALKKRISELEGKLQTVENVEKMELVAKLAEAQVKLTNADIEKLKLELKDANQTWLTRWVFIILGILSAGGIALWYRLMSKVDDLIVNGIEKRLDGFKNAMNKVETMSEELRLVQKHYVVSVIEDIIRIPSDKNYNQDKLRTVPEQALIDVFCDRDTALKVKSEATKHLGKSDTAKIEECIGPGLDFLNLVVNTDRYPNVDSEIQDRLRDIVKFIGQIKTQDAYVGLKHFLSRLPNERQKLKDIFLTSTVYTLAYIGSELDNGDSVSMIRNSIPDLDVISNDEEALKNLVGYFDKFNVPEGIKELLEHHGTAMNSDVKETCLNLLEKYDPESVKVERKEKASTNTSGEKTDESQ